MAPIRRTRVLWIAGMGFCLALATATLGIGAGLGYRTDVFALGTAFSVLRWGAYVGAAAAVLSLVGVGVGVMGRDWGLAGLAAVGVIVGGTAYRVPAEQMAIAQDVPPIHDITTDTEDPPAFVDVLPLRADAPNPPHYDRSIAPQQEAGYPDLTGVRLSVPPTEAFTRALEAVDAMGWDLVAAEAGEGRIEATDTTFWFGFRDDVVVRIRPADGGSVVDVRSKSRVGGSDVGANAARIRAYTERLTGD